MSARYHQPRVEIDPETRMLRVSFRLENRGREPLRRGEISIGSQIHDPDTSVFIAEGEWTPIEADIAPGAACETVTILTLPPERGRYRIYVSPIHAKNGWHYERGGAMLVIDAEVEQRRARICEVRTSTLAGLHREHLYRAAGRAFTYPLLAIIRNWSLIRSLVRRDILARYRGSFGDVFWTVLNPLLLMSTYFFVFGVVLRTRFAGDTSPAGFALYFLAGMLPWLAFAEAAGRAPNVVLEHRNFVKKLVFPVETLPVVQAVAGLVTQAFALGVFLVALLLARGGVPVTIVWLPVLLIPQLLFTLGLCWFFAATGAFVRDLGQVIGFVLTLWFFLTPICYPEASLPPPALAVLGKNPIFVLVRGYRAILLEHHAPPLVPMLKLLAVSAAVFVAGHAWFYKLRKSFADVI